jgi:YfiH family protein
MSQCHGSDIALVDGPWQGEPPSVDGIVTTSKDVALAVLVADCTPVLLVDRVVGVAAAVHAGRPGMLQGIVGRAVDAMTDLGARSISAVVGPSVCGRCYEVPEQLRAQAAKVSPVAASVSWQGTPAIDVAAGVVDQLQARSVAVQWIWGCSRESEELFSYRRQHRTGRFAGVVRLLEAHTEGGV